MRFGAIDTSATPGDDSAFSTISRRPHPHWRARAALRAPAFALLLLRCALAGAACPAAGDTMARVAGVTDRLELELADGRTVRLAGLDAPDPGRGDPQTASNARAFLLQWLVGRETGLKLLAPRPDRWNRTLADLFVAQSGPDAQQSMALALLAGGFARVRPEAETRDCLAQRLAAETAARAQGLGLWTDPYYAVVSAGDGDDLRARDGLFAIVEGKVQRVGVGRSRYYIDFGRRGAFTATIPRRQEKQFARAGLDISALTGARLRLRGALDNRFGLRMEIADPQQIERVEAGEGNKKAVPPR
jgi:endonuclease YncB( thermonuclease family)